MLASTAQVRVVKSPNKLVAKHNMSRVYVAFNVQNVNSKNAVYTSGDVLPEDLPRVISTAVANLRAKNFILV